MLFFGDAIAAAGPRFILAVGNERLTLMELHFLVGPIDCTAHAVRDVNSEIMVESDDPSLRHVEIGVMGSDDGIIVSGGHQLLGVFHAARDYGIRIEAALCGKRVR